MQGRTAAPHADRVAAAVPAGTTGGTRSRPGRRWHPSATWPRPRALALLGLVVSSLLWGVAPVSPVGATSTRTSPLASGCTARASVRLEPSHRLPPRSLRGFTRTYCDDFLGGSLARGWYRFAGQPGGDPGAMFSPTHVRQTGGMLTINTYRGRSGWVTGGVCQCGHAQTYGAFFVRSRITGAGDDNDELLWPAQPIWPPEIDFNETSATTAKTGAYVHYTSANRQIDHELRINLTGWHTWGVIWTSVSITFTVDGRVWGRVTDREAIPRVPMTLDLQEQTFCQSGSACPRRPVSLLVDWVAEFAPIVR